MAGHRGRVCEDPWGELLTFESIYGTRPDLLPRSIGQLARGADGGTQWVGRDGVELLGPDTHRALERQAFRLLPRDSDGTVEWSKVATNLILDSNSATAEAVTHALSE